MSITTIQTTITTIQTTATTTQAVKSRMLKSLDSVIIGYKHDLVNWKHGYTLKHRSLEMITNEFKILCSIKAKLIAGKDFDQQKFDDNFAIQNFMTTMQPKKINAKTQAIREEGMLSELSTLIKDFHKLSLKLNDETITADYKNLQAVKLMFIYGVKYNADKHEKSKTA